MVIVISILSIFVFAKTIGYAIYEYKDNGSKVNGVVCTILAFIALIGPIVMAIIR